MLLGDSLRSAEHVSKEVISMRQSQCKVLKRIVRRTRPNEVLIKGEERISHRLGIIAFNALYIEEECVTGLKHALLPQVHLSKSRCLSLS